MPTSFVVYCMALMSFIGWWLFALFGGVGLASLPIKLIQEFLHRPKPVNIFAFLFKI